MRALTVRVLRRCSARLREQRGAVAVMVALFMVPLLGFGAIAVDVASLYADRERLQTAADAAAIAVAVDCATGSCGNPTATATSALTANAGGTAGTTLNTPGVALGTRDVTVTVSADQAHWFAPVLGINSTRVTATSTATWTAASQGVSGLPLAMSWCEYRQQVAQFPLTSTTSHRLSWATGWLALCSGPDGRLTFGGGHGLTALDASNVCRTTSAVGDAIDIQLFDTRLPGACTTSYLNGLIGSDIQIAVWDDVTSWSFGGYRAAVYGYALFHLTSYTLTSGEPVFYGYFTRGVQESGAAPASTTSTSSAPYLGSGSVHLTTSG
jgi:Flp pilus assembly protein TadG